MKTRLKKGDALLIIDAQKDFFPGGALPVPEGDLIIPVINAWIDAANAENVAIYASRDWHPANHCSFKDQGGPWPMHCVQHSLGAQFHPDIQLPENTTIIDTADDPQKEAYSAFQGVTSADRKPLDEALKSQDIKRLWLCGLALDFCVCETALEARKYGYEVHLLIKGTMPIYEETGEDALQRMRNAGVMIEEDCFPYS